MEIMPYEQEMSPELTSSYNKLVNGLPYCYPIRDEDFESVVLSGEHSGLSQEAAFVARAGDSLTGFAYIAVERPKIDKEPTNGVIRLLWYDRGHRAAGQALLETAENYFRERRLIRVRAFHQDYRCPFYHIDHAYLSDRLGHIYGLMGANGYRRSEGEVYLDWPDYEPLAPEPVDLSLEFSLEWEQGRGKLPGLELHAFHNGKDVGTCVCDCMGESIRADEAQDWLFTTWIRVLPHLQGRGLGRHLLRRALQEAHGAGYRHASISTNWRNYRALLFYSNFGYHVVDWTYGLQRRMK